MIIVAIRLLRMSVIILAAIFIPLVAHAGPPFVTDDPVSLPTHSGELYLFASGTKAGDGTSWDAAPGIEANYSFFKNTFFHLVVPLALNELSGGSSAYGMGDMELGFKWQLLEQWPRQPDIGIFPLIELPTGDADHGLGAGEVQVFLPVWLQKDVGSWTTYGGGGYWINPGEGNRNWWFSGILLQKQLSSRLYLGAEIFHQTADIVGGSSSTGFNLGGGLTVAEPYQILFSAGRNIQSVDANEFSFYAALYRTL